jgi:nucleoside-diphosphate-sugar epimerase
VVGATGHIGSYLVPRLTRAGHEVVAISRGERRPYRDDPAWSQVETLHVDRDAEDRAGTFAARLAAMRADAVVDLMCFTTDSAAQLADALAGSPTYLLHCGTIWVHGPAVEVPITESAPRRPFDDYGINKAAIEAMLLDEASAGRLRATVLHPGHIVGPGWRPVNPAGNLSTAVFGALATGKEVALPNLGLETLHHVHADDVAQAFELALAQPAAAIGESFHVVSERALTMRGYAESVASWFGRDARLRFEPFQVWRAGVTDDEAEATWSHLAHSPCASIDKARALLGFDPAYSSLGAVREALAWLVDAGEVETGGELPVAG